MNIEEFFKGIYCINLDERTDRWEESIKEFKKLNIEGTVNRFSAVKHSKGAIGCRESHLSIIRKAKELDLDNVLIFEDDLFFIESDLNTISQALGELHKLDWDLFYFGATLCPHQGRITPVTPHLVRTNFAFTTHAYAINKKMFDFILDNAPKHPIIDLFYCRHIVSRGNSFIINPMLCIQRESFSDIEKHHADYGWMVDTFNSLLER
mgnify:CR=1 FL=1|tara:strand:- start:75 stop:698 length:624 start_codon:yes stop_codon:yes gene_type:complete